MQPERCAIRREYVYVSVVYGMGSLGGVRSIHECLCLHVSTVLVTLSHCFGMDIRGDAPICVSPRRVLAWTACMYVCIY